MIKQLSLMIEYQPTCVERPIDIGVMDGGKIIGVVSLESFDHIAKNLEDMRQRHAVHMQKLKTRS